MDFLNDGRLEQSMARGALVDFCVMDVGARRSRGQPYGSFVSLRRVLFFREFSQLYGALAAFSVVIAAVAVLRPALFKTP